MTPGLQSLQNQSPVDQLATYYTYGEIPPILWPQTNPPPKTRAERDRAQQQPNMGGGYADGGETQGGLGALSQQPMTARGEGTGRSDSIPARLSDGEYVFDAETVAMLGDGSTEAGCKILDEFRAEIRRHKSQGMDQGQMSPDAKSPMQYLQSAMTDQE